MFFSRPPLHVLFLAFVLYMAAGSVVAGLIARFCPTAVDDDGFIYLVAALVWPVTLLVVAMALLAYPFVWLFRKVAGR